MTIYSAITRSSVMISCYLPQCGQCLFSTALKLAPHDEHSTLAIAHSIFGCLFPWHIIPSIRTFLFLIPLAAPVQIPALVPLISVC